MFAFPTVFALMLKLISETGYEKHQLDPTDNSLIISGENIYENTSSFSKSIL